MNGHKKNGVPPGHAADVDAARELLSQKYRVPTVDLAEYAIEAEVLRLVPKETCERHHVIPVSRVGGSLVVAMADPNDHAALDALRALTGLTIEPVIATRDEIVVAIAKYYPS